MSSEASPLTSSVALDQIPTTAQKKSYKCSLCDSSFSRQTHLNRHFTRHIGEKAFACPCGQAFSRHDALSRHQKRCEKSTSSLPNEPAAKPNKRKRLRLACERCVKLKTKCDYENPCMRCVTKGVMCQYVRGDESNQSLVQEPCEADSVFSRSLSTERLILDDPPAQPTMAPHIDRTGVTSEAGSQHALTYLHSVEYAQVNTGSSVEQWTDLDLGQDSEPLYSAVPGRFEWNDICMTIPWKTSGEWSGLHDNCVENMSASVYMDAVPGNLMPRGPATDLGTPASSHGTGISCFLLEQIDPLEAKCGELRALLNGSEHENIANSITRQNLLLSLQLYGKHFQHHFPIIHSATFSVSTAPPILLLAIFCVGATYAKHMMEQKDVFRTAMCVLLRIEQQPHELNMTEPPVSTIQASMAACCVLACSQDELAAKFVTVYFARNISMAKRAGVFDSSDPPDYNACTEMTFDWHRWIEREIRNRIAACLFNQDAAYCIFKGGAPSLSPLDLEVEMPTYESVWHSRTAAQCLQKLQSTPSQLKLSACMRLLRVSTPLEDGPAFEASALGMFTLLTGLHCLIWHHLHYDVEVLPEAAENSQFIRIAAHDIGAYLEKDLSGATVTALAADMLPLHGSANIVKINHALDKWMYVWENRRYCDWGSESKAFSLDPLPMWWLAKLFLILHCGAPFISPASEFANVRGAGIDTRQRLKLQAKVFGWLSRFRNKGSFLREEETGLTALMKPIEGE